MEKISKNIDSIASEERFKRSLRNKEARRLSGPEKTFASMINTAGRKAYFDEYFYGIPLEDQELPQIKGISDIKATQTFQEGYQRGAFLVSVGNVPEEYQNINNSNKASEAAASGSVAYPGQMGIADKRAVVHRFRKTVSAGPKNRTINTVILSRAIKAVGRNAFTARPSPVTV